MQYFSYSSLGTNVIDWENVQFHGVFFVKNMPSFMEYSRREFEKFVEIPQSILALISRCHITVNEKMLSVSNIWQVLLSTMLVESINTRQLLIFYALTCGMQCITVGRPIETYLVKVQNLHRMKLNALKFRENCGFYVCAHHNSWPLSQKMKLWINDMVPVPHSVHSWNYYEMHGFQ